MALYSVYEPAEPPADPVERADALVFVKDGFSWPALFLAPFWLLYHRMWIGLVLFIGGVILLDFVLSLNELGEAVSGWAAVAYLFFFAMEANALRRYSLERKGYELAGMAFGGNRDEAEVTFFNTWLPGQRRSGPQAETAPADKSSRTAAPKAGGTSQPARPGDDGIIGSFPNA